MALSRGIARKGKVWPRQGPRAFRKPAGEVGRGAFATERGTARVMPTKLRTPKRVIFKPKPSVGRKAQTETRHGSFAVRRATDAVLATDYRPWLRSVRDESITKRLAPPPPPLILRRTDDKPRIGSFQVAKTPAAPRLRALRPEPTMILMPGANMPRPMSAPQARAVPIGQPDSSIVVATSVGVTGGLGTELTMVPADLNFGPLAEITQFTIIHIDSGTF